MTVADGGRGRIGSMGSTSTVRSSWLRVRNHLVSGVLRTAIRPTSPHDLVRLGSAYGGWWVPASAPRWGAVAYCAGVGEDITFDLALHERGCTVIAIDPVPRAAAHVASQGAGDDRFLFIPCGLAALDGVVPFFAPQDREHVSYSMVDLQRTGDATNLPVKSLRSIMTASGHDHIDILKIDIEGAEYEVLDQMMSDGPLPGVLCVEFDQPAPLGRTLRTVRRLHRLGYRAAKVERFNVTFLRTPTAAPALPPRSGDE